MQPEMTIRIAPAGDRAVTHLARLDSADPPAGRALVAEIEGRLIAAVGYEYGEAVADPFERTADVLAFLRERAAQLRGERLHGRRGPIPSLRRRLALA